MSKDRRKEAIDLVLRLRREAKTFRTAAADCREQLTATLKLATDLVVDATSYEAVAVNLGRKCDRILASYERMALTDGAMDDVVAKIIAEVTA